MINIFNYFNKKKLILVTHNVAFHADDIFACATLSIFLKRQKKPFRVIRTRDQIKIDFADYVFDVGGVYDPSKNRFDHHQIGGAGARENEVPYAAFGLVWKEYGPLLCGSPEISQKIDESLVQSIDSNDNGVDLFTLKGEVSPFLVQDLFYSFRPSYTEEMDYDTPFFEMVELAEKVLLRVIKKTSDSMEAIDLVKRAYLNSTDKRIVVLDGAYPWGEALDEYPNTLYVVYPKLDTWRVEAVRKNKNSFENRKSMPEAWAGKRDLELSKVTGVKDSVFCHNGRWLAVAKTKEAAMSLAEKALLG